MRSSAGTEAPSGVGAETRTGPDFFFFASRRVFEFFDIPGFYRRGEAVGMR
jgi:hypothetical protein